MFYKVVKNPDISFYGKCQNDSKSGFLTIMRIREKVVVFIARFLAGFMLVRNGRYLAKSVLHTKFGTTLSVSISNL